MLEKVSTNTIKLTFRQIVQRKFQHFVRDKSVRTSDAIDEVMNIQHTPSNQHDLVLSRLDLT